MDDRILGMLIFGSVGCFFLDFQGFMIGALLGISVYPTFLKMIE